jgi:hypothetical protein
VPFPAPVTAVVATAPPPLPPRRRAPLPPSALSALYGLAGAAALALGLLAGAVIVGANETPAPVTAATAVATVTAQPTAVAPVTTPAAPATVAATFAPDWPSGQTGWTIQLQTLPKDGTTPEAIAAAKAAATGQGAADVGALDSDTFASLDGGNYVIYSGVSTTKKAAEDALSILQPNFPDASAVEVSDKAPAAAVKKSKSELRKQERSQTPEQAQRNTRKAPPTVQSEGTPPPADNKKPGAGSGTTEIG